MTLPKVAVRVILLHEVETRDYSTLGIKPVSQEGGMLMNSNHFIDGRGGASVVRP